MDAKTTHGNRGASDAGRPRGGRPAAKRSPLAWLRVQRIPDIHGVYDFLRDVRVRGRPVQVIRRPSHRFHVYWPPLAKRLLLPAFDHAYMLFSLLAAPRGHALVIREFDNFWFSMLAPAFWLFRRRLILNVNQNFARPLGAGPRSWALKLISHLGFRLLWLDGGPALAEIRPHFPRLQISTPLFPVHGRRRRVRAQRSPDVFTVGLVGYFREDKGGVATAVARAAQLAAIPGIRVAAGFWNDAQRAQFAACAGPGVETCSTFHPADYHAFLMRCHAVVVLAQPDSYYYRHSGIAMDCIRHGTIPVCPDYPVLASVVLRPVPVGAVYGDGDSLRCVIRRVVAQYAQLRENFAAHAAARSPAQVGAALEEMLLAGQPQRGTPPVPAK